MRAKLLETASLPPLRGMINICTLSSLDSTYEITLVEEEAYEEVEEEASKDETEIEVELHSAVLNGLSMLIVFSRLMLFKF
ncbi:hypothetical protein H5410_029850 [Solanum commersonii]|uniref:Uncharacterized protein n=1 Tax=Solanum commersonii TaxID=4109 RepID=A0A9J5YFS9_SOLCO|nr:hypothetical protein H5410_029850 [Solanum commersonii]